MLASRNYKLRFIVWSEIYFDILNREAWITSVTDGQTNRMAFSKRNLASLYAR